MAKCAYKEFSACSNGVGLVFGTIVFKHNFGAKQLQSGIKPEADIHTYIHI